MTDPKDYGGGRLRPFAGPAPRCPHGIREVAFCPACDAEYREKYEPAVAEFTSFTVHVAGDEALTVLEE